MMFLIVLFLTSLYSCDLMDSQSKRYHSLWESHKAKHRPDGFRLGEEKRRFELFKIAVDKVDALNKQHNPQATFALNFFADMTQEEKQPYFSANSNIGQNRKFSPLSSKELKEENEKIAALPTSVDWRQKGAVTHIKNQGQCGSSPFFSAVVSMEGAWAIAGNKLVSLSDQQVTDCDTFDQGCNGGFMTDGFQTVLNEGGIESEADYPYTSGSGNYGPCKFDKTKIAAKFSSYVNVTPNLDSTMMQALTITPVASAIDANQFEYYSSGIFSGVNCSSDSISHGIGVVGYGVTASKVPYYILKNTWGTDWGMKGYIYLQRGNGNQCGITFYPSYAVV